MYPEVARPAPLTEVADRSTFQDWVNLNRGRDGVAVLYKSLDDSGYATQPEFIKRHAADDQQAWCLFFVKRDVPRALFNYVWRRFLRETGR
jgi:hypothetical protein